MQDSSGRGPWRPGLSNQWISDNGPDLPPAIHDDVDNFGNIIKEAKDFGLHIGVAIRGHDGLKKWFQPDERVRLALLGFRLVDASGCEVLAETESQVLIGSAQPLCKLPVM